MDYSELIQAIKDYSYHELVLLRDTLIQKIDMVYQTSDDDPENTRADLRDQLNAVIAEIEIRIKNGEDKVQAREPDKPTITPKPQRLLTRPITLRLTPKKILIIIVVSIVLYKMLKR